MTRSICLKEQKVRRVEFLKDFILKNFTHVINEKQKTKNTTSISFILLLLQISSQRLSHEYRSWYGIDLISLGYTEYRLQISRILQELGWRQFQNKYLCIPRVPVLVSLRNCPKRQHKSIFMISW